MAKSVVLPKSIVSKKCVPGMFCIENMTLFLLVLVIIMVIYIFFLKTKGASGDNKIVIVQPPAATSLTTAVDSINLAAISAKRDPFNDPYAPPLKNDALFYASDSSDIRGVPRIPINMQTRGVETDYQQVGILTRVNQKENQNEMILPLMGRKIMTGRDKWQYYTISNTGSLNTKLPIRVNGRSCTNEYGCDDIMNQDTVYVEGYNDVFRVTMYENNLFRYIPY